LSEAISAGTEGPALELISLGRDVARQATSRKSLVQLVTVYNTEVYLLSLSFSFSFFYR
jgi:hypothetical protein